MCREYDKFDIIEVAQMCGLVMHPNPRNSVEFKALCPFCGEKKYHLGLNRQKGRFNCLKCKESGNSVSLYAKLHGISNKEAYMALKDYLDTFEPQLAYLDTNLEMPIKPPLERHNVYYDFLRLLKLNEYHKDNLFSRGLTGADIHRFMYRSIPTDRVFRREVIETLAARHDLVGIPGFYRDNCGDFQMYFKKCGGMFIPVCNKEGYIQGLQMRLDVPEGSDEKKFRWFSSKHFENGTGAKSWIHIVGDTSADEACLTEGAMKADITSVLSDGRLFLAVPGVNAIGQLPEVIKGLKLNKVYECFDMDKCSKPEVKNALISLKNVLKQTNVECVSCSWSSQYKGIDDYYLAKVRKLSTPVAA
ncbi:MAG: DNA primase [Firmicutes bacterium ADurb.Bin193]|nr:MAG: DNA primase [Firmicutes bacterium ADurb.Bin193]